MYINSSVVVVASIHSNSNYDVVIFLIMCICTFAFIRICSAHDSHVKHTLTRKLETYLQGHLHASKTHYSR